MVGLKNIIEAKCRIFFRVARSTFEKMRNHCSKFKDILNRNDKGWY